MCMFLCLLCVLNTLQHTLWFDNIDTNIYLQSQALEGPVCKMDTTKQTQIVILQVGLAGNLQTEKNGDSN